MNRVFVLDTNKTALAPCMPSRARQLLNAGKAAVYRYKPFTIILHREVTLDTQDTYSIGIDPGAVITGMALIGNFPKQGNVVVYASEITHRSRLIKKSLSDRNMFRAHRRNKKLRYRPIRYWNRTKPVGWLPPSLISRIKNILYFTTKYKSLISNLLYCNIELPNFDIRKLNNPQIKSYEYSVGPMTGFSSIRDYLIHRDGNCCAYCGVTGVRLEKDHIIPKASGGNSPGNLVLACRKCNEEKSNTSVESFLLGNQTKLSELNKKRTTPQWAASAMNSSKNKILNELSSAGLEVSVYSGYQTKLNREFNGYRKEHWIDAACTGNNITVSIPDGMVPTRISAIGHGSRRVINHDKYGFPRINKKTGLRVAAGNIKRVHGFSTGDFVKLLKLNGKYAGVYFGRISSIRKTGKFTITINTPIATLVNGVPKMQNKIECAYTDIMLIQHGDGYHYTH